MPAMAWTLDAATGVMPATPWLSHQGQLQASRHTSLFLSAINLIFHRNTPKLYLPTFTSLISILTGRGIARLGIWQLCSCLWSYFAVGTVLTHLNEKLCVLVQICSESKEKQRDEKCQPWLEPWTPLFVPGHIASHLNEPINICVWVEWLWALLIWEQSHSC